MARFRHYVADEQWKQIEDFAVQLGVPARELFNVCAAIGLNFFKLGLNPPKDLLEGARKLAESSPEVERASEEALRPLKKYAKRKASKKKTLVR